jgi:hypothetical protein
VYLGHHAQAEAQSCWCGASSLRKAFGPRLHGCGAVGTMLQTALQRLQVLSPAPPPTMALIQAAAKAAWTDRHSAEVRFHKQKGPV